MACWKTLLMIAVGIALSGTVAARPRPTLLRDTRSSPTDLEIDKPGVGEAGRTHFVSYESLLALPQVTATIVHPQQAESYDDLPAGRWTVQGVALDVLTQQIGETLEGQWIEAICSDGYDAPLPSQYIAAHRPILVLKVDGMPLHAWAAKNRQYDPGPYLITYDNFVPAFHVLAHEQRAQKPSGVMRLKFQRETDVLRALAPLGPAAQEPQVVAGFRIAQENCFRCHNQGVYGGTKADRTWAKLGDRAGRDPAGFEAYIYAPLAIDPTAKMPGNPQYDAATVKALRAYFKTFAWGGRG